MFSVCQLCHEHGHIAPECTKFQICQLCEQLGHTAPQCFQLEYNYIKNKDCPISHKKFSCGKELKTNYKPNLNVNENFQESGKRFINRITWIFEKKLSIGT